MNTIGIICMVIVVIQPILLIIGLIKPTLIIPLKHNIKNRRIYIFVWTTFIFFLFAAIGGNNMPDSNKEISVSEKDINNDTIIQISTDSAILLTFKPKFDCLYSKLIRKDTINDSMEKSRSELHKEIQDLLFNKWWGTIEQFDSLKHSIVNSKQVYYQCAKKYDKQYARFLIYGEEDIESIRFWAESESEKILKRLVRDPKSLSIEDVYVNGKVKDGWKCTVVYRATNGFGGFTRESIVLIMAYNEEESLYKCISVI